MTIKAGDYVVLTVTFGKRALAKCTAVSQDGKKCRAVIETSNPDPEPAIEFKIKEVIANLGHAPSVGSVYGIQVEPLRERIDSPFWGEIQVHHTLDDVQRKTLRKTMADIQGKLKSKGAPKLELTTQIKTQNGAMAGFYKFRPKAETDILCVKLDEDLSDLEYRFSHEYAHGIWHRSFTPKMRMAWINMFHKAVAVTDYDDKDLKAMLEDLKTNGDLRSFMKENPDDHQTLRAIFRHIKQVHQIERNHFEMALMLGEDIDQYWPTSIELGEKSELLTKYATKSPEELWAETFSLKFIGKKLPAKLDSLLDNCMRRLVK